MTNQKMIIFCHTCNRIVGSSFPCYHSHGFGSTGVAVRLLKEGNLGFGVYADTPENRQFLAEHYPPRNEITINLTEATP